ncbi:hypothetical protein [Luteibaculum oceani]|uniref:Uncharacterized protein n=1 Tax=Luteibaculum oceani TaxID=1294296 RepID=A0A5C6VDJ1_9FLAO|nr:hypothetical protein [Luteibaculum oceani]TXC81755.1 hypothetical protein FRX97_04360 [Luteibaculum oceani]
MDNLRQSFGKFLFPAFLIAVGIVMIITSLVMDQNASFILGSTCILLVGIVSLMYSLDKITKQIQGFLTIGLVLITGLLVWKDIDSVQEDIRFADRKKEVYAQVIQRLKDLREVQLTHKKVNGTFIAEMDSLMDFLENGKLPIIKAIGSVPDTLTEEQALEMGIIVRDTIMVSVLENLFLNPDTRKDRKFTFVKDSLPYAPVSGVPFWMNAGTIESGGVNTPVFEIKDMKPFDKFDTLKVGSMNEASTSGNWSGE